MTGFPIGNAMKQPVLVDDLERLRAKLDGPLRPQWDLFLDLTAAFPGTFPEYAALAFLMTGKREHAQAFRRHLVGLIDVMAETDFTDMGQFHTWTHCFAPARQALMQDWIAPAGVLTEAERARFAEAIVDYTWKHAYLHAHSRYAMSDNQIANMLAACLYVGFYFGAYAGADARARRLYAYALRRWPELPGLCPPGGYGGEGSGYNNSCLAPVIALMAWLLQWHTGRDYLARRYPPNGVSALDMLKLAADIYSPGGLWPPWDHYGFARTNAKTPLVMLARFSGRSEPLKIVSALNLWNEEGRIGFGNDDRLWSLLFWPDRVPSGGEPFPSWCEPHTAAALDAPARRLRLFQMWDRSGAGLEVSRRQVNPNAIILEAFGSPFLMDGAGGRCPLLQSVIENFASVGGEAFLNGLERYILSAGRPFSREAWLDGSGIGQGTLGAANSVVIDEEGFYTPDTPCIGRALAFGRTASLAAVTAEVGDSYRPRYDIRTACRTSLLVNEEYGVVVDRLEADTSHRFRHQFFLRRQVTASPAGLIVETPERNRLHIAAEDGTAARLDDADGFPIAPDGRSVRASFSTAGTQTCLAFLFWPEPALETVVELDGPWKHRVDGHNGEASVDIAVAFQATARHGDKARHRFARHFTLPDRTAGKPLYLWIDRWIDGSEVSVNGRPVATPVAGAAKSPVAMLPKVLDIGALLTPGENLIELAVTSPDGTTLGPPIRVMRESIPAPAPVLKRLAEHVLRVERGARTDLIVHDNHALDTIRADGIETDARVAVRLDGRTAFLDARRVRTSGLWSMDADAPVSGGMTRDTIWIQEGFQGTAVFRRGDASVSVRVGDDVQIERRGSGDPTIELRGFRDCIVLVNEEPASIEERDACRLVRLAPPARALETAAPTASPSAPANRAVRLEHEDGPSSMEELLALALHEDWRVRTAAVESLGHRRDPAAVPRLLEVLEGEEAAALYPPVVRKYPGVPQDGEVPRTPDAARRWRLKLAAIEALGEIGDSRAVPAIARILVRADDYYPVTSAAAEALGAIGDASALPALREAAHSPEHNTQVRVKQAMARINGA